VSEPTTYFKTAETAVGGGELEIIKRDFSLETSLQMDGTSILLSAALNVDFCWTRVL